MQTLSSNEVTSKNKTIHFPSPSPSFKVGLFFLEEWHSIIVYRGMGEVKFYFIFFKLAKRERGPVKIYKMKLL